MVIKEIDLNEMEEADQKASLTEAKVMEMLNHPNIVKFYDVYKTKKKKSNYPWFNLPNHVSSFY